MISSRQGAVLEDRLWRIGYRVAPTVAEVGVGVDGSVDRAGSPSAAEVRRVGVVVLLKVAVEGSPCGRIVGWVDLNLKCSACFLAAIF